MPVTIDGSNGVTTPAETVTGTGVWSVGSTQIYKAASGNVGIGTSSPNAKLKVSGADSAAIGIVNGASYAVRFGSTAGVGAYVEGVDVTGVSSYQPLIVGGSTLSLATGGSERMRVDTSGNLLVGTATNNSRAPKLCLYGNSVPWSVGPSDSNSTFVVFNAAEQGVYMGSGSTSWSSNSDERLKTDLVAIENAIEKVATLRSVTGRFKSDEEGTSRAFLIAQDVQAVFPEAVSENPSGMLGLSYTDIVPLLTAAIKEQQAIITQLQADVAALKGATK